MKDNIFGEIMDMKSAHEIWVFLNEKYGAISKGYDVPKVDTRRLVTLRIIEIIVVIVTLVLEGARVPSLLLLGPVPIVVIVVHETRLFLCFGTIISQMIFSFSYSHHGSALMARVIS